MWSGSLRRDAELQGEMGDGRYIPSWRGALFWPRSWLLSGKTRLRSMSTDQTQSRRPRGWITAPTAPTGRNWALPSNSPASLLEHPRSGTKPWTRCGQSCWTPIPSWRKTVSSTASRTISAISRFARKKSASSAKATWRAPPTGKRQWPKI
ncbi:hypothetical protein B0T16DRAFT_442703 [Cercophora newfieldiana]|uniref:Uncharacterized protein n=1 Tax=Cercophora newfieldiana TaxID=92897 RepID=A0AA39YGP0_9PEZI|nr:hypothetical protein B0T16DRAFT_442703 [Cercophora newfieldiana]